MSGTREISSYNLISFLFELIISINYMCNNVWVWVGVGVGVATKDTEMRKHKTCFI